MSKLSRFKAALAKALQEFGAITTDKGVLTWDGDEDVKAGDSIFIEGTDGERTPATDGEYKTEDNRLIQVADGKVTEIKDADTPQAEPQEETLAKIATDKGELIYDGESELKVGDAVFQAGEEGENVPAQDGEYVTEDGQVIKVADGVVAEIGEAPKQPEDTENLRKENETLKKENAELKAKLAKLQKMPAARPAHQEITSSVQMNKTGVKGLDNLARILAAK